MLQSSTSKKKDGEEFDASSLFLRLNHFDVTVSHKTISSQCQERKGVLTLGPTAPGKPGGPAGPVGP